MRLFSRTLVSLTLSASLFAAPFALSLSTLVLSAAAQPTFAGNGKGKGGKNIAPGIVAHCPPGLAKKNPSCVPPGQVKNAYPNYLPSYRVGDRIYRDYRIIRDWDRYGLNPSYLYYLVGREVFRISPDTGRVIAFIGLADALLN